MPHGAPPDQGAVVLPAILDQRTVEATRDVLLTAVSRGPVILDGSAVERVGTIGIHLLLSAAESAAERSETFRLTKPSPALVDSMKVLGLDRYLANWMPA